MRNLREFKQRSNEEELLDSLDLSKEELKVNLDEIDTINKWLGGNRLTIDQLKRWFKNNKFDNLQITDLGCGNGNMLRLLERRFKAYHNISFVGYDYQDNIIDIAKSYPDSSVQYKKLDLLRSEIPEPVGSSIALATLFLHHLKNEEIASLISNLGKAGYDYLIINDLHRHLFAYYGIKILTALFSRSRLTRNDAAVSVMRGFNRKELEQLFLNHPKVKTFKITWKWAFRWSIFIKLNPNYT
jgi:2-polyprenyl-3-methyl-5-hydroxy-6-metoxy-1,4-benzoquinol methylase